MSPPRPAPVAVNPNRERVHAFVQANPGCSLQDIADAVGLTRTSVGHHIRTLVHAGHVDCQRQGRRLLHFPTASPLAAPRSLFGLLRVDSTRQVLQAVCADPSRSVRSLARELGLAPHTVRWHLDRLEREGLLQVHGRIIGPRRVEVHPRVRAVLADQAGPGAAPVPALVPDPGLGMPDSFA